jgi:hypothetical protein
MNGEQAPQSQPEHEHAPRLPVPATMERTASRFQHFIIDGIADASDKHEEIDVLTARSIAHVLGRAFGRTSALADFGRTGNGSYEALRDEYLALYTDETTPAEIKEWINWFGTFLVQREGSGSGRQFMGADRTPDLSRLLVQTRVDGGGGFHLLHAPASLTTVELDQLVERLTTGLEEAATGALWAFLALPNVNAADPNLLESFNDSYIGEFPHIWDALYGLTELTEWERELKAFAEERGIFPEAVNIDLDIIENQTRDVYDLIEIGGILYAFNK